MRGSARVHRDGEGLRLLGRGPLLVTVLVAIYVAVCVVDVERLVGGAVADRAQFIGKAAYCLLVVGLALHDVVRRRSIPRILTWSLLLYCGLAVASSFWSYSPITTLSSCAGLGACVSLALLTHRCGSSAAALRGILMGCAVVVVSSLALMPVLGDSLWDFKDLRWRFAGITYGANAISRCAGIWFSWRLLQAMTGERSLGRAVVGGLVFAIMSAMTSSRQPLAFPVLSVMAWWISSRGVSTKVIGVLVSGLSAAAIALVYSDGVSIIGFLARNDESDVITLTNRTPIWHWVWGHLIEAGPAQGYGYGAGAVFLQESYSAAGGWTTPSAHNMFLQAALDFGLVGAGMLALCLWHAIRGTWLHREAGRVFCLLIVIYIGLAEQGIAGAPDYFFLIMILCQFGGATHSTMKS